MCRFYHTALASANIRQNLILATILLMICLNTNGNIDDLSVI